MNPNKTRARITGFLYLVIIALALFAQIFVRGNLIVRGDPAATAENILASELLFRFGFAADLVVFLCDVAVAVLFYVLLRPVSDTLSALAASFRLVMSAIFGINLVHYFAPLLLLEGGDYLSAFRPEQLQAWAMFSLKAHNIGYHIGLVFFAVHCFLLGLLLFRSSYVPKALGVLMVVASLGYLANFTANFLVMGYGGSLTIVFLLPTLVAELSLSLWLLIRGVDVRA